MTTARRRRGQQSGPESKGGEVDAKRAFLADKIYLSLRDDILLMRIPPRATLDEAALVRRFGVSRTPIREAIRRLAADRVVDVELHRSATVLPILAEGVRDYFEWAPIMHRAVLTLGAARAERRHVDAAQAVLAELEEAARRRDAVAFPGLNNRFLLALAESSDNRFAREYFERLLLHGTRMTYVTVVRDMESEDGAYVRAVITLHRDLLRAFRQRDLAAAAGLSNRYVSLFRERLLAALMRLDDGALIGGVGDLTVAGILAVAAPIRP